MNRNLKMFLLPVLALALLPNPVWACAACYGQSDSPLAKGMNLGILSLLVTIVLVLGGVASFFVYLARKSVPAREPEPHATGHESPITAA